MKSIDELLLDLSRQDIKLWVDEAGLLRYQAPQGTLSSAIKAEMVEHKAEILAFLQDTANSARIQIQPAPRDRELPLSFAQQRLWFINELEPHSSTYNMSEAIRLTGQLDLVSFERTLQEIIRRHEALRTNFISHNGQPIQVIQQNSSWQMALIDLQDLPTSEREAKIQQLATVEAEKPFALDTDYPIRVTLIIATATEHILLLTMHHIVSDGWSIGVLVEEIAMLYAAFVQGNPSPLAELEIQYVDFAVWQRQWLQGETLERQLTYWQQQLANAPALLELPTDRPRPPVQTFRGAEQIFTIPADLTSAIHSLSRREGVTIFMTLLAAFDLLLSRYTGQTDILVGSGIANRHHGQLEGLIGFFVNTLVLRTDLSGNPSFRELLVRVHAMVLPAYAHQDLPFEMLVDVLRPERIPSHSPLFQVAFVLQNAPASEIELAGLTLSTLATEHKTAKLDLTLSLEQINDELIGVWEYNTDLFDDDTIARMAGHFQTLLTGIVAHPEQPIAELPLLTVTERHQLLFDWNDTAREYPQDKCIHQLFEEQAARTPDAIAVVFEQEELTYQQLNQRANQLAHHLQTLGVKPEVLVGICVERSLGMVIGLLGILKAGGAYVPLDPDYPAERLAYITADAQIVMLLTQEHLLTQLLINNIPVVCLDSDWPTIAQASSENLESSTIPENLAYAIYTSGSTGQPKGVMISQQNLLNFCHAAIDTYGINRTDRILQFVSVSFDVAAKEIYPSLIQGATICLRTSEMLNSATAFWQQCQAWELTMFNLPSAYWQQLTRELVDNVIQLPVTVRLVIIGGERANLAVVRLWQERVGNYPQLINCYGPTEATVEATYCNLTTLQLSEGQEVPIGKPLPNVQAYVLDAQLQPLPVGVVGELHIGGAGIACGYLKRPELTAEKFIAHPFSDDLQSRLYKTGDLARYLPDGNIEFVGRIDHQVKIRGFRIELGEIETVLSHHSQIQQAVVIATIDPAGNQRLVAYVVVSEEEHLSTQQLRESLQQQLPAYMVPSAFIILGTLPITPNGKVDRKALPAPDGEIERTQEYVAPRTEIEQILTTVWQELLLQERVSIHDNFFEIGGDSILSIQVVSRAKTAGVQITPKQLFQHQTIAALARVANTTQRINARQGIVTGNAPLTPIQHWFWAHNIDPHHYNQSVLLQTPPGLSSEFIATACQKLLEHHDALRLSFPTSATEQQQINHGLGETVPLTIVDLSTTLISEQPQAIAQIATSVQASLNLSTGLIMQIVMFDLGHQRDGRLLIVIHHLAVDGVSWRILLSDLETIYQQLITQQPIQISPKTTAFIDWAEKLERYAQSELLKSELDYWLNQPWEQATSIPLDLTSQTADNTIGSIDSVAVALSATATHQLLGSVHEAYNTQINDLLLTGLAMTLVQWTGNAAVTIDLEGHGREELFEDVDLSRTVGWFTSLFPVLLQLPPSTPLATAIKSIKEQLRTIPQRGVGYGILRYLCADEEVKQQLQRIPSPAISFNYLGQFDQVQSATGWKFAPESTGQEQSSRRNREHRLDLNCLVMGGELQISWTYSSQVHHRSTIKGLAQRYLQNLTVLIEHCQSEDACGYTPSDFPEAQLEQSELDELLKLL
jgi:amino acid adenylation domain-containing protein/non-ribosomal peptide synthase protein (TIGR01720 family)